MNQDDLTDLEDARRYYEQLGQSPTDVTDPEQPKDGDIADLQAYADRMQSMGDSAKAQQPKDADVAELQDYAKRMGLLPQTPSALEGKQAEPEASNLGTYRGKNYDVLAAGAPAGKGGEGADATAGTSADYAAEGEAYTRAREQREHDRENAKRIQAGQPTIEEEKRNQARKADSGGNRGRTAENEHPLTPVLDAAKSLLDSGHANAAHVMLAAAIPEPGSKDALRSEAISDYNSGKIKADVYSKRIEAINAMPDPTTPLEPAGPPPPPKDPYAGLQRAAPLDPLDPKNPDYLLNLQKQEQQGGMSAEDEAANKAWIAQQNNPPPPDLDARDQQRAAAAEPQTAAGAPPPPPVAVQRPAGPPPPTSMPLQVPQQRVVGGGWQFAGSPAAQADLARYRQARDAGLMDNEIDARLANQRVGQFHAQRTEELQAEQEAMRQRQIQAVREKQTAQNIWDSARKEAANAKIDPDKAFGGGFGKMLAMIGAAFGAFGATITKTPNQAAEMIRDEVNASLEAQKAEIKTKEKTADNAYARLLAATGDEKQADAAFRQMGYQVADSQAQELGSQVRDAQMVNGLRGALAETAKEDLGQDLTLIRQTPQTVVGGVPQAVMKEALDYGKQMVEKSGDPSKLGPARDQYLRERGYASGGRAEPDKFTSGAGAGRSAGVQIEHRRMLGRFDSAIDMVNDSIDKLNRGYQWDDEHAAENRRTTIAEEYAYLMHGGASEGSADQQKATIPDLNPLIGSKTRAIKVLEQIKRNLAAKKLQEQQAGESIPAGQGFGGPIPFSDIEADTGAKED